MTNKLTVEQCDRDAMEGILWVQTIIDDRDAIAQAFARHRQQAEARAEELVAALEDVINPLANLKRYAVAKDCQLSGAAYSIANDLHFVQGIARTALTAYRSARP